MVTVIVFEDCCCEIQQWDDFNEQNLKQYCDFDERTSEGDDVNTTIEWVTENIAHIAFCDGPHFIFIKQ